MGTALQKQTELFDLGLDKPALWKFPERDLRNQSSRLNPAEADARDDTDERSDMPWSRHPILITLFSLELVVRRLNCLRKIAVIPVKMGALNNETRIRLCSTR